MSDLKTFVEHSANGYSTILQTTVFFIRGNSLLQVIPINILLQKSVTCNFKCFCFHMNMF